MPRCAAPKGTRSIDLGQFKFQNIRELLALGAQVFERDDVSGGSVPTVSSESNRSSAVRDSIPVGDERQHALGSTIVYRTQVALQPAGCRDGMAGRRLPASDR